MRPYHVSLAITVMANVLYHCAQRSIPKSANPVVTILVTYAVAGSLAAVALLFSPAQPSLIASLRQLNWASAGVGVAIVAVELGFLFAYRAGWKLGLAAVTSNVVLVLVLLPLGTVLFREPLSIRNAVGALLCVAGLLLTARE